MKDRTKRSLKHSMMEVVVLIAVIVAFFVVVGVLALLRHESCDRLDAVRVSHLQPGHETPGPEGIYIIGADTDRSQAMQYYEAVSAMESAGC